MTDRLSKRTHLHTTPSVFLKQAWHLRGAAKRKSGDVRELVDSFCHSARVAVSAAEATRCLAPAFAILCKVSSALTALPADLSARSMAISWFAVSVEMRLRRCSFNNLPAGVGGLLRMTHELYPHSGWAGSVAAM